MTRFTRIALLAGATLSVLVVAGCQRDGATPTSPTARVVSPVAPGGGGQPNGTRSPLVMQGSDGHTYQVNFNADGTTSHLVDGSPYAAVTPSAGGNGVAFLSGGQSIYSDFYALTAAGPVGLPSVGGGAIQPRPPRLEDGSGPQALMTTCGEQIRNYIIASGVWIAAGAALAARRTSTTIKAMSIATAGWVAAWIDLYNCESLASTDAPPVMLR